MRTVVGLAAVLLASGCSTLRTIPYYLPPDRHRDPAAVRIVTADLPRFYAAYDAALADTAYAARIFTERYLKPGTPGLHAFTALSIEQAEWLAGTALRSAAYYDAIRPHLLALDTSRALRASIHASMRRFQALYPEARFPDVTLVVGRLNTGGTASSKGLLIGAELYGRGPDVPARLMGPWLRAVARGPEALPYVVTHEAVHAQQPLRVLLRRSMLARALVEGGADFLAELASGGHVNPAAHAYGAAHEAEVWDAFQAEAQRGGRGEDWFYRATPASGRPPFLGYFVGYRIAAAYYARATDKQQAVRALIRLRDPEAILRASGYAGR